jgi:hypothetical protein
MGNGPRGSPHIDPATGAPQADIFHHYKEAILRATALDRATRAEERRARREKRTIRPEEIDMKGAWGKPQAPFLSMTLHITSYCLVLA